MRRHPLPLAFLFLIGALPSSGCDPTGPSSRRDGGTSTSDAGGSDASSVSCEDGTTRVCGSPLGVCRSGRQTCTGGVWGACEGATEPAGAESCGNWLDDDCDGATDEGCACTDGETMPCHAEECGQGGQTCVGGSWSACETVADDATFSTLVLVGRVRDFPYGPHPDFEITFCPEYLSTYLESPETGLVERGLDPEGKPALTSGDHCTVTSPETFADWYRDVDGTNAGRAIGVPLSATGGETFTYDDGAFFPIDGELLDTEPCDTSDPQRMSCMRHGRSLELCCSHNYLFTTELRGRFTYRGGERFTFSGDDDLWIFVNGQLALDLGGLHVEVTGTIDFDAIAASHGLMVGGTYEIAIFHAERAPGDSHFRVNTTLARVDGCELI